ncbi:DUF6268 family outer membrane beta-barrel protein [Flavobacterium sp. NRK F10]|uniref:DUF6268 family outer membrane beta-barrel protein n=1 Tax=Flavobacterium sp. NRK F10 TaxID=2954931 RepID=UPI002091A600|nr:DUF6268 family outer membrane beta-barrel protein [Flavobacterium sp. NRK F10]MCO6176424.1 DUF6268 family outer membrane beta-barrel protein [Flavobacterium sp. NRK F10]
MNRLIIFVVVLSFSCSPFLRSQTKEFPLAGISYQYDKLKYEDIDGYVTSWDAFINYPIKKVNKSVFLGKMQLIARSFVDLEDSYNQKVYGLENNFFWNTTLANQDKWTVWGQAGLFSDFVDISEKDIRYSIGFHYLDYWHDRLKTGYGIGYSRQFYGHQINPFLSIDYRINPKLKLTGMLPVRPKLTYQITENWSCSNEFYGNVDTFRLSETEYENSFIRINNWYYLSKIEYLLKKHHLFTIGVGFDFVHNLKFYNDSNAGTITLFTFDLNEAVKPVSELKTRGFKFQVSYRFIL